MNTQPTPCYTREPIQARSYVEATPDPEVQAARAAFRVANASYKSAKAVVAALSRNDPAWASAVQARSVAQLDMITALQAMSLAGHRRTQRQVEEFRAWAGRGH